MQNFSIRRFIWLLLILFTPGLLVVFIASVSHFGAMAQIVLFIIGTIYVWQVLKHYDKLMKRIEARIHKKPKKRCHY